MKTVSVKLLEEQNYLDWEWGDDTPDEQMREVFMVRVEEIMDMIESLDEVRPAYEKLMAHGAQVMLNQIVRDLDGACTWFSIGAEGLICEISAGLDGALMIKINLRESLLDEDLEGFQDDTDGYLSGVVAELRDIANQLEKRIGKRK